MTREEYEFNYNKLQLTGKDAVSRLYIKSLEQQLAEYKKRIEELEAPSSCGTCKWYNHFGKYCSNENSIAYHAENAVYEDDYCKDYELKDKQ